MRFKVNILSVTCLMSWYKSLLFTDQNHIFTMSFLNNTALLNSTNCKNLTIDEMYEILKGLNWSISNFSNQTIERNLDIFHVINFSIEGIFLPLLCLLGLAGN